MLVRRFKDQGVILLIFIGALIGGGIVLASTAQYGIGLSPDSVSYVAAAESFAQEGAFLNYDASPFILWPPLYPLLLSGIALMRLDIITLASLVHAILFGLTIFVFGLVVRSVIRQVWVMGLIVFLGATAFPLIYVNSFAWAEGLFLLFEAMFFYFFIQYFQKKHISNLFWLAAASALMVLTRYIGVLFVVGTVVMLLVEHRRHCIIFFKRAAGYGILSLFPVAGWFFYNQALYGTMMGERSASSFGLLTNIFQLLKSGAVFITPLFWPIEVHIIFGLICLFLFTVMIIISMKRKEKIIFYNIFIIILYLIGCIILLMYTTNDHINYRYISPVMFPLLLFLGLFTERYFKKWHNQTGRIVHGGIIIVMVFVTVLNMTIFLYKSDEEGVGWYGQARWQRGKFINYLGYVFNDCDTIYSNAPDVLYIQTRKHFQFIGQLPSIPASSRKGTTYSACLV